MTNKELFYNACTHIKREGIDNLLRWMETETDFFTAPSSTKYHGNYEGGLVEHSLNVMKFGLVNFNALCSVQSDLAYLKESLIISCLFHDLCKVNIYSNDIKWAKNSKNEWKSWKEYKVVDAFPLGHGPKSIYYILQHMKLKEVEATAIIHHMGHAELSPSTLARYAYDAAFAQPLVKIIHCADVMATAVEISIDYKSAAINS